MSLSRKEFLNLSGSMMGLSLFYSLTGSAYSSTPKGRQNAGDVMVEVKTKRLELKHTWTLSRNTSNFKNNVFVKIEKDGIAGYGEAAPNVRYGENAELTTDKINNARHIFSENELFHYNDIKDALNSEIIGQSCAKAALDIALMDWVGKALNIPLYRMLGLNTAKAPLTSFSIGIDTVEIIKQKVKEAENYPLLKI